MKLSKAQREFHVKNGKGLFGDILRKVRNGAVSGVQWVGDKGLGAVGNLASSQTGRLTGLLPSAYGISSGADSILKKESQPELDMLRVDYEEPWMVSRVDRV